MSTADGADTPAEVVDLACQRLMSRWGVSEKVARGMIAIEKLGVPQTNPPDSSQAQGPTR